MHKVNIIVDDVCEQVTTDERVEEGGESDRESERDTVFS